MREIGGYIEFEHYHHPMLHENAIKLNCGRSGLAYIIKARHIKKIAVPYFQCDSVSDICIRYGAKIRYYHIGRDLMPNGVELEEDEWLLAVNYYGQMTPEEAAGLKTRYKRVILDNTQAYFDMPLLGIDTMYSCRKFFGVPDGGLLYTDAELDEELPVDMSMDRMGHLLGRFEYSASEYYAESVRNNDRFDHEPIKRMSRLTENLLRAVDYEYVKNARTDNFSYLNDRLGEINLLRLRPVEGAFAYPLLIRNGAELRKTLIANKVYVPTLWPNVVGVMDRDSVEYELAENILPLPCDQRYGKGDMQTICDIIKNSTYERSRHDE